MGPDGRRCANLIVAIGHPVRRRVLRLMTGAEEPSSPARVCEPLEISVSMAGYHVRVLNRLGAVRPDGERTVRGALEHLYVPTIEDVPPIEALLEQTRAFDEGEE